MTASFNVKDSLRAIFKWHWITLALLFVAGLAMNSAVFLPWYNEINYWDELVYVSTGKNLLDGVPWPTPRGPLISFVYAFIYPFSNLFGNWLLASDLIGRWVAYSLIVLSAWLVGRELQYRRLSHPLVLVGLFTALPLYIINITNPSYALFLPLACLSFWGVLRYGRTQSRKTLFMASILMGSTLLVRPDPIIGSSFVLAVLINTWSWRSWKSRAGVFCLATVPMVLLVGGYTVAFGLATGSYQFGGSEKMYTTFEAAQQILMDSDTQNLPGYRAVQKGKEDSEKYFGTAEENNHSVLRAVLRNPERFAKLVWVNTVDRTIPMLATAYGGRAENRQQLLFLSLLVGFFALRGAAELARRGDWRLLLAAVIWPAHLIVYLITYSFPGYLGFPFYIALMLGAIGLSASVSNLGNIGERLYCFGGLLAIYLASAHLGESAKLFVIGGLVICGAAAFLLRLREERPRLVLASVILGIMALNRPEAIRVTWPGPVTGYEQQAAFLKDHYPKLTAVLAYPAAAAVLAKMRWIGMWEGIEHINSTEDLRKMIKLVSAKVVLVDPFLTEHDIYGLATSIRKYGKGYLTPVWQSEDGKFQVLVPRD